MSTANVLRRVPFDRRELLLGTLLINTEILLLSAYYAFTPHRLIGITPLLPMVWINVGIWAVTRVDPPQGASQRKRTASLALATAYFGVLAYFGGIWRLPVGRMSYGVSVSLFEAPPGLGPQLFVNTPALAVLVQPYKLVGYLALAYLVYVAVLEVTGSVLTGALGLFSCVSCTWPILATVLATFAGSGTGLAQAAISNAYPLSTVIFVATVGLLVWRPGWD